VAILPEHIKIDSVKIDTKNHQLILAVHLDLELEQLMKDLCKYMLDNHKILDKLIRRYGINPILDFVKLGLKEGFDK